MPDELTARELGPDFWVITDPGYAQPSHSYLVLGQDRAALIDAGTGLRDMRAATSAITDLEVVVVQTHAHPDHAGGSHQFDLVLAHPRALEKLGSGWGPTELRFSLDRYYRDRPLPNGVDPETFTIPPCTRVEGLENRGVVDLGRRQLDIFFTPGHSVDSICILDLEHELLFTGDSVVQGKIAIENSGTFRRSIAEISRLASLATGMFPAHGETPVNPDLARRVQRGFADATTDRHPSGFIAGFATFSFDDFGLMLPPRRRRVREE